jgi:excisionase family DNA binding protein
VSSQAINNDPKTRPPVRQRGFSPEEVATITGLSVGTIRRGVADGTIPSTKYKRSRIISEETVETLLAPA